MTARDHQEAAFVVAVQEDKAVWGVALSVPAVVLEALDGGGHSVAEVGAGFEAPAVDDLSL